MPGMIRLWFLPWEIGLVLFAQYLDEIESLNLSGDFDRSA